METRRAMKSMKRLLAFAISLAILAVIFSRIDLERFLASFAAMDWFWFLGGLVVLIPIFFLRTVVLRAMLGQGLASRDALGVILAAQALNVLLPSKGGDLAKGLVLPRHTGASRKTCLSAVVLERVNDVMALALVLLVGLVIIGEPSRPALLAGILGILALAAGFVYFAANLLSARKGLIDRLLFRLPLAGERMAALVDTSREFVGDMVRSRRIVMLAALAILLWLVNVFQFYCFFQALGFQGPWLAVLAYAPAAIFIGLLPITIAGIGTRDVALIFFFAPWAPSELTAGVALLSHLRYAIPALLGTAVAHRYIVES